MKKQSLTRTIGATIILAFFVSSGFAATNGDAAETEVNTCLVEPQVSQKTSLADMQSDVVSVRSLIVAGKVKEAKIMVAGFNRRYPKYDIFKHAEFALLAQNNPSEWERRARKTIGSIRKDTSALLNFCMTCSSIVHIGASPNVIKKGVEMVLDAAGDDPAILFFAGVFYVKVSDITRASALFHRASQLMSGKGSKADRLLKSQIEVAKQNLAQLKRA